MSDTVVAVHQGCSSDYQVCSSGQLLDGFDENQVRAALSSKFSLQATQLNKMLAGRIVLKAGLNQEQAERYVRVLRNCGLDAQAERMSVSPRATANKTTTRAATSAPPPPAVKWDRTFFENVFAEAVPRFPTTLGYRLGLISVALLSMLAPLIYFGIIVGVAALLGGYIVHLPHMLKSAHNIWIDLVLLVVPPFVMGVFILFLLRPFFIRDRPSAPLVLDRKKNRRFFDLVDVLCDRMGLPAPMAIHVDGDVNASVSPEKGLFSVLRRRMVLTVGLPLFAGLSSRQLIGVLAHELGHCAQPIAIFTNYWVNTVNYWMATRVMQPDPWDERLHRWGSGDPHWLVSLSVGSAKKLILASRYILRWLFEFNLLVTRRMSREMEYDADRYECWVAGSDTFAKTALDLRKLSLANYKAIWANKRAWNDSKLMEDLPQAIQFLASEISEEETRRIQEQMEARQTQTWDTHPADNDRIAHAQRYEYAGIFRESFPASELLPQFGPLCRTVTLREYNARQYANPSSVLVANSEVIQVDKTRGEGIESLRSYFNETYTDRFFDLAPSPVDMGLQSLVDKIRKQLLEHRKFNEVYGKQRNQLNSMNQGRALLDSGVSINAVSFDLPQGSNLATANQAIEQAQRDLENTLRALRKIDALFAARIHATVNLMDETTNARARQLLRQLTDIFGIRKTMEKMDRQFHLLDYLLYLDQPALQSKMAPKVAQAGELCRQALVEFHRAAASISLREIGNANNLLELAKEWFLGDEPTLREMDANALYAQVDHCLRAVRYAWTCSLAELAKLCEQEERRQGIRPLKLVTITTEQSVSA